MENKKDISFIHSLRDVRGASIVIALSMIAAIMFFTIGMASTMIMAIQNTSDSKKAVQAEYAAQGGVELANWYLSTVEIGMDTSYDDSPTLSNIPYSYLDLSVTGVDRDQRTLYANPANYRTLPIKGLGNAGSCSDSSDIYADCNWNKLYYGDSIEVPLYIGSNIAILNDFNFRVRSPDNESVTSSNDVVLTWQLTGESCSTTSCVCAAENSGITSGDIQQSINTSAVSPVITLNSKCVDSNATGETPPTFTVTNVLDNSFDSDLIKPKLRISYVKSMENVPYFEYQFYYTGNSLAAMYRAEISGFSDSFKFYLDGAQGLGAGLFDFAVQN